MDTQEGNTNKTTPQRKPLILRLCAGLFILIFTVGFMLIGGGIIYSACRKDASYTGTATGTVMGYVSRPGDVDDSFQYFYAPVIRYETMEGSFCTGTGNVWTSGYPFEVGEQISIRYNPEQTDVINVEGYGVSVSYKLGAGLFLFGFAISVLLLIFFFEKSCPRFGHEGKNHGQTDCRHHCAAYFRCMVHAGRDKNHTGRLWDTWAVCALPTL